MHKRNKKNKVSVKTQSLKKKKTDANFATVGDKFAPTEFKSYQPVFDGDGLIVPPIIK